MAISRYLEWNFLLGNTRFKIEKTGKKVSYSTGLEKGKNINTKILSVYGSYMSHSWVLKSNSSNQLLSWLSCHRKNRFSQSWMAGSWCKIWPDRKASLWAYLQGAGTLMVPGQFQYMWHSLKVNLQPKKKILSLLLSTFILGCNYVLMGVWQTGE